MGKSQRYTFWVMNNMFFEATDTENSQLGDIVLVEGAGM